MNVILLNTFDDSGGSVRACQRLLKGLSFTAVDATMLVREKSSDNTAVKSVSTRTNGIFRALVDGALLHLYPHRQLHVFAPAWSPGKAIREATRLVPDIIHLHWIVNGFVRIEDIASVRCPVVWTLHDSWPFTGGCHLPGDCTRYEQACGRCPVLGSKRENDLSRRVWNRKWFSWDNFPFTVIAPSRWIAEKARASALFRDRKIVIIPNAIDASHYCPGDKQAARRGLGLPGQRKLILFGAHHALSDQNKGFELLLGAIKSIGSGKLLDTELIIFGASVDTALPECGIPIRNLGIISDEQMMVRLYRSADLVVVPSRQENLPYVVMEAMACGTPCVAFQVGGIQDLITHGETGFMARPLDVGDLAAGIHEVLNNYGLRMAMAENSRRWIEENVDMDRIAQRHVELYQQLLPSAREKR